MNVDNLGLAATQIAVLHSDLVGLRFDLGSAGGDDFLLERLDQIVDFAREVHLEIKASAIRTDASLTPEERTAHLDALFFAEPETEEGEEDEPDDGVIADDASPAPDERQIDLPSWDLGSVIGDLAALRSKAPQIAAEIDRLLRDARRPRARGAARTDPRAGDPRQGRGGGRHRRLIPRNKAASWLCGPGGGKRSLFG